MTADTGGTETRPRNVALMYIINADGSSIGPGGGGTGTPTNTNIFGTAKVWGSVTSNGTKKSGLGYTVTKGGTGLYVITFDEPRTDVDYSIMLGPALRNYIGINYSQQSINGFNIYT